MTDVLVVQTPDEGDMECVGGTVTLTGGFETAVYLSLFGPGESWWGNLLETDPARQYRSETEAALDGSPPIPANLRAIEQAATRDLEWMVTTKAASTIDVTATMPDVNKINLSISVGAYGREESFEFTENWKWRT